jgi:cell division protein ZapA (FtsZ GTPase activity inhibitor)
MPRQETDLMEATLGHMHLKVPILVDRDTTQRIAAKVNARLAEIERNSERVDTQAFALLAAMSFAMEAEQTRLVSAAQVEEAQDALAGERQTLREESQRETRDVLVELDRIAESLKTLPKKRR